MCVRVCVCVHAACVYACLCACVFACVCVCVCVGPCCQLLRGGPASAHNGLICCGVANGSIRGLSQWWSQGTLE